MQLRTLALPALVLSAWLAPANADTPTDLLAPTRAAYKALKSYSDTGVLIDDASGYRHTFRTYYRAPRHFYFEFNMDPKSGGWRYVMWCDGGDFQSWTSYWKTHETYQRGSDTTRSAFAKFSGGTQGTIVMIPSLIYAGSGLVGLLDEFADAANVGAEIVSGRRSTKLMGVARSTYPASGRVHNVRRTTVWVDAENQLVRKVFEDTAKGMPAVLKASRTILFEPQANPTIDDSKFRFVVLSSQK
jgi:outer membrane lipoprotein-sorting protein